MNLIKRIYMRFEIKEKRKAFGPNMALEGKC